ncbi:MAG: cysteine--tRNA ligase, partial [Gammaproteobacteria bacterium]
VVRYLRRLGYDVTYVRNITDIDDKIIQRANELGVPFQELTERFIQAMHEDAEKLGLLPPDIEPRASQSIDAIIEMIKKLIEKGYAYVAENGDVYYDVSKFKDYGKLSGKRIEELQAGARVEVGEHKRHPLDFALWKAAKPGEPAWDAPWGKGRPGWHIECSAMSTKHLGPHFDIHGGGADLQFPHHENEIAQSEAATGHPFANFWMHVGFVKVREEKMSKSLGNVFLLREVLERWPPEAVRYFLLSSHYRSPLNFTEKQLDEARAALTRLYIALRGLPGIMEGQAGEYGERFYAAMDDDFNTPRALAVLHEVAGAIHKAEGEEAVRLGGILRSLGSVLGLLREDAEAFLKRPVLLKLKDTLSLGDKVEAKEIAAEEIEALIAQRAEARKRKDWAEADRIRKELAERGIILEDRPDGTTVWRRA